MSTSRKIQLYTGLVLVGVFLLGTLTGTGITLWSSREGSLFPGGPPDTRHRPPHFGPWSLAQLQLSAEQERAVHGVFDSYRPQLDAVLREGFPKVRKITEKIDMEVRALLESEQKELFDKLRHKRHKRRGPMSRPSGPPFLRGPPPGEQLPPFPPAPFPAP